MSTLNEYLDATSKLPCFCRMILPEGHPDAVWRENYWISGAGEWLESDAALTKRIKEAPRGRT